MALSGPYPPFTSIGPHGELGGFDYDIGMAICAEMQQDCHFANMPFHEILPALARNELDFAMAGFSPTPERREQVDFTGRYFRTHSIFLQRGGPVVDLSPPALRGKRLGTQAGSIQAEYLRKNYPDSEILLSETFEALMKRLREGGLDLAFVEGLPGYAYLKTPEGEKLDIVGEPVRSGNLLDSACIAVSREQSGLRGRLDQALEAIRLQGIYERINRKYFDFTIY